MPMIRIVRSNNDGIAFVNTHDIAAIKPSTGNPGTFCEVQLHSTSTLLYVSEAAEMLAARINDLERRTYGGGGGGGLPPVYAVAPTGSGGGGQGGASVSRTW